MTAGGLPGKAGMALHRAAAGLSGGDDAGLVNHEDAALGAGISPMIPGGVAADGKVGSSLVVLTSESELTAYRLQFGYKGPAIRFGNFDQLAMFLGHEATTGTTHVVFDPWDEKRILISTSNFLAAYGSGSRDED